MCDSPREIGFVDVIEALPRLSMTEREVVREIIDLHWSRVKVKHEFPNAKELRRQRNELLMAASDRLRATVERLRSMNESLR